MFELKPLSAKSWDEIPLEAAEVSSMAMNTLQTFYSMVENKRNTSKYSLTYRRTYMIDEAG